jgi:hypothetical protein
MLIKHMALQCSDYCPVSETQCFRFECEDYLNLGSDQRRSLIHRAFFIVEPRSQVPLTVGSSGKHQTRNDG